MSVDKALQAGRCSVAQLELMGSIHSLGEKCHALRNVLQCIEALRVFTIIELQALEQQERREGESHIAHHLDNVRLDPNSVIVIDVPAALIEVLT